MCGICGAVSFTGQDVQHDALARMCARLVHRGPDGEGIHVAGSAGLAQRRLSIIDLSPGAVAPLSNEDGTIWVTFNGEIYNFQELRAELAAKGHVFKTAGDTEVIVHLYEQEGLDCLSRLRGMFALAIWDGPEAAAARRPRSTREETAFLHQDARLVHLRVVNRRSPRESGRDCGTELPGRRRFPHVSIRPESRDGVHGHSQAASGSLPDLRSRCRDRGPSLLAAAAGDGRRARVRRTRRRSRASCSSACARPCACG